MKSTRVLLAAAIALSFAAAADAQLFGRRSRQCCQPVQPCNQPCGGQVVTASGCCGSAQTVAYVAPCSGCPTQTVMVRQADGTMAKVQPTTMQQGTTYMVMQPTGRMGTRGMMVMQPVTMVVPAATTTPATTTERMPSPETVVQASARQESQPVKTAEATSESKQAPRQMMVVVPAGYMRQGVQGVTVVPVVMTDSQTSGQATSGTVIVVQPCNQPCYQPCQPRGGCFRGRTVRSGCGGCN